MLSEIWSGGQTGVDRGALDAAILKGIPHNGWCPLGRRAEDGRIPDKYNLRETNSVSYPERTRRNIEDTDATIILHNGRIGRGTSLTIRMAVLKPHFIVTMPEFSFDDLTDDLADFLSKFTGKKVNFAGPRESTNPGIQRATTEVIYTALLKLRD